MVEGINSVGGTVPANRWGRTEKGFDSERETNLIILKSDDFKRSVEDRLYDSNTLSDPTSTTTGFWFSSELSKTEQQLHQEERVRILIHAQARGDKRMDSTA
jgi:hypothetical protein